MYLCHAVHLCHAVSNVQQILPLKLAECMVGRAFDLVSCPVKPHKSSGGMRGKHPDKIALITYEERLLNSLGAGFPRLGCWQLRQPPLQVISNRGCCFAAALLDVWLESARARILAPAAHPETGTTVRSAVPTAQTRGWLPLLCLHTKVPFKVVLDCYLTAMPAIKYATAGGALRPHC